MVRVLSLSLILVLALASSGCGLILHGSNQTVSLQSEPSGAEVYNDGALIGRTPVTLTLPRNASHQLTFRMAGYGDQPLQLARNVDGLAIVGDLLLGVVPLVVDFATGAMYKLSPDQAIVVMRREGASLAPPAEGEQQVMVLTRGEAEAILGPHALDGAVQIAQ